MRNTFDLSHYSFMSGRIGLLKTLSVIPVIGGDSLSVNLNSILRLSPLRRTLMMNAIVDYFAFYIPHRHIYGDNWTQMIEEGVDSAVVLSTIVPPYGLFYLGNQYRQGHGAIPMWQPAGYNRIWNRYFRFLTLTPEVPDNYVGDGVPVGQTTANSPISGSLTQRIHGFPCARIKMPWSTGVVSSLVDADKEVPAATDLNIVDLAQVKKAYKTKLERDWFAHRYNDVMKNTFGSGVNIDADERPELIMRKRVQIGARDVDGTGDANLGTYSAKAITNHQFGFRRKFFPEGGAVWMMALVRFPTVALTEMCPLNELPQTYPYIAGDADLASVEEPLITNMDEWLSDGTNVPVGTIPFGQFYRFQQNVVDRQYDELTGFPFLDQAELNTHVKAIYMNEEDYTSTFQTTQIGQWQCQSAVQVQAHRKYPSAKRSLYAGV